jgi:hypothetical protein
VEELAQGSTNQSRRTRSKQIEVDLDRSDTLILFAAKVKALQTYGNYRNASRAIFGPTQEDYFDATKRNLTRSNFADIDHRISVTEERSTHLTTFYDFMHPETIAETVIDKLHPKWFRELTDAGPARSKPEALIRGRAMLAWLVSIGGIEALLSIDHPALNAEWTRPTGGDKAYFNLITSPKDRVTATLRDLLTVLCLPTSDGALEALRILGMCGGSAIALAREQVFHNPLAWRSVRVLGQFLRMAECGVFGQVENRTHSFVAQTKTTGSDVNSAALEAGLVSAAILLKDLDDASYNSLYRARSFWEEAARYAPIEGPLWSFVDDSLDFRAVTGRTRSKPPDESGLLPVRERMYAAFLVWYRAEKPGSNAKSAAIDLAERLRSTEAQDPGLLYAADFLDDLGERNGPVAYPAPTLVTSEKKGQQRPECPEHPSGTVWAQHAGSDGVVEIVETALSSQKAQAVWPHVSWEARTALWQLVAEAALTIDGTRRRTALEAIMAAGLAGLATRLLKAIVTEAIAREQRPRWLIEHSVFCAGYLGTTEALGLLRRASGLWGGPTLAPVDDLSIRYAAMMALADLGSVLEKDRTELDELNERCAARLVVLAHQPPEAYRAELRAIVYMLAMTRPKEPLTREIFRAAQGVEATLVNGSAPTKFADPVAAQIADWGSTRVERRLNPTPDFVRLIPVARERGS